MQIEFLDRLDAIVNQRFGRGDQSIDTRSNLSFEVLQEICGVIGIDAKAFEPEATFINKLLVERRNHIAHGREISITESDFSDVADRTIVLMRAFNNAVQYAALEEKYRKDVA